MTADGRTGFRDVTTQKLPPAASKVALFLRRFAFTEEVMSKTMSSGSP
jgi:hypothetical protein